ncbi:MAG: hypothetical protein AB1806_12915 [Acidobacteriota bacterium]
MSVGLTFPQIAPGFDPREQVETAIGEAVRLLESKDYRAFLLQFAPPDQVKARGGAQAALEAWVELFSAQADHVLAAFTHARTRTPTYDAAGTTATFLLKGEIGPPSLRMVKIGKYWYLGNK